MQKSMSRRQDSAPPLTWAPCPVCGETLRDYWQICPCCRTEMHRVCEECGGLVTPFWIPCQRCRPAEEALAARRSRTAPAAPSPALVPKRGGVAAAQAAEESTARDPFLCPVTGIEMVWIPPGQFQMGGAMEDDERPTHTVRLSRGFWMGRYPVTQIQWTALMGANPSSFQGKKRPVENITWHEANAYIDKINAKTAGYRLPTEAEWEYASRAGRRGRWCFGNDETKLPEFAWTAQNSGRQTHEVGKKKPNAWGLFDMHGNVWEWCSDWFGPYSGGLARDPVGPAYGDFKVVRGGSWYFPAAQSRCAYRDGERPEGRLNSLGFRLVRTEP